MTKIINHTNYENGIIQTWDNFLLQDNAQYVSKEVEKLKYSYGEADNIDSPPTGLVAEISNTSLLYTTFFTKLKNIPELNVLKCTRSYVNIFSPNEKAYYHVDNTEYTALYYPNRDWNINDEGETKFLFTNTNFNSIEQNTIVKNYPIIISIAPIPNRLVIFKGDIYHTATSFKNSHRFSLAFKFYKNND